MWAAFRRMGITEVYARIIVALVLAMLGSLGALVSWNSAIASILVIATMVVIYRIKYRRW